MIYNQIEKQVYTFNYLTGLIIIFLIKVKKQHQKPTIPIGAHLSIKSFGYTHHGIYVGKGKVIHYSGFAHLFKKRPIEITSLKKFSHQKKIRIHHYEHPKFKGRTVVRRMRSRMHENNYHLITNNCEHLCHWAITGIENSPQVIKMMNRLTTIGYISSLMSYMNSIFITVATASFALVLYIKKKLRDKSKINLAKNLFSKQRFKK